MNTESAIGIIESVAGATDSDTPFGEAVACLQETITALEANNVALRNALRVLGNAGRLLGVAQVRLEIPRYEGLHERIDQLKRDIDANPLAAAAVRDAKEQV